MSRSKHLARDSGFQLLDPHGQVLLVLGPARLAALPEVTEAADRVILVRPPDHFNLGARRA